MKAKCPIGAVPLQLAAKLLAERDIDTGGHKIFKQLREIGMLRGLHPSLHAEHMGWLIEKHGHWERGGADSDYCRIFITYSGLDEAEAELKEAGYKEPPPPVVTDIDIGVERNVKFGF